jgi:hypothetical protein
MRSELSLDWTAGECRVAWEFQGSRVEVDLPEAPVSVAVWSDPTSVIVVEPIVAEGRLDNAIVYEPNGRERVRLMPPVLPGEPFWRRGYYTVFMSEGVLTAVFSTTVGDFWGVPDLVTGELHNVTQWR